jgi:protein SCO1/2
MTKVIPGYGDVKLPVLSYVQPFRFTNQDGKQVTEKDMEGKVYVAEYFFTTCVGICPKLNTNMKKVYEQYKDSEGFLVVSHTCNPETDSAARLRYYADSMKVDTKRWWFLTGTKDSLYTSARVSYLLDDPKNNLEKIEDQFMHTQFFALVDKSGQVRKIYDGLKEKEIAELGKDIGVLLKEPVSRKRFSNNLFGN